MKYDTLLYYDEDARTYDQNRFTSQSGIYYDSVQRQTLLSLCESLEGKTILEIGCGTGRFSTIVAARGAALVSADFSMSMLQILREKSALAGVRDMISPIRLDAHHLSFRNQTFQGCICVNLMHLLENHYRVLSEINRVLEPNGFLILNFPNLMGWYLPVGSYVNLTGKALHKSVRSHWYTSYEFMKALSRTGFTIEETKGHIVFPVNWSKRSTQLLVKLDKISRDSALKYLAGSLFVRCLKKKEV